MFCWANGGTLISTHGVGRTIFGETPVSVGGIVGQIAHPCAACRIPKYSPPAPPPVIVAFIAHPPALTTAETIAGLLTADALD